MKRFTAIGLIVTILSGCSKFSDGIEAIYISPLRYGHLECFQVQAELSRVESSLKEVVMIHDKEANKDMTAAMAGLIILPVAALLMIGGGDRKEDIRRLKGEIRALEETAIEKNCTHVLKNIDRKRHEADEEVGG